jgi:hypothetical protein
MSPERETLSASHLHELTGKTQYSAQRRWLDSRGWVHAVDGKGQPVVDRRYYNMRMGLSSDTAAPIELDFKPLYG